MKLSTKGRIIQAIRDAGSYGRTDDEIETILNLPHQSVSARRGELVKAGHVLDSGRQRRTKWGRLATVWTASPANRGPLFDAPRGNTACAWGHE